MALETAVTMSTEGSLVGRIVDRIHSRLGNQVRNFGVTVLRAGLILTGRTHTYYGKQIAQHVAMEMTGCAIAANRIEVRAQDSTAYRS